MNSVAGISHSEKSFVAIQAVPDLSAYSARLKNFFALSNPKHLFQSANEIKKCQLMLLNPETSYSGDARKCKSVLDACVHPTTNEIIPAYARIAAFAPVNIPICAGLLFVPPTLPNLVGWQWINQTYNAVFNYCNAAGSSSEDKTATMKNIGKSYAGAVAVSVGLAVGLNQMLKRAKLPTQIKSFLRPVVPYTAVASAGMANVGLMRLSELSTGLPVSTPDGRYIGHSKIAAKKAVRETMLSRAVLSIPSLLLPPPLIALALRWRVLRSSKILKGLTELSLLTVGLAIGLPVAISLYPQAAELPIDQLEAELQEKAEEMGGEKYVVFNKGI